MASLNSVFFFFFPPSIICFNIWSCYPDDFYNIIPDFSEYWITTPNLWNAFSSIFRMRFKPMRPAYGIWPQPFPPTHLLLLCFSHTALQPHSPSSCLNTWSSRPPRGLSCHCLSDMPVPISYHDLSSIWLQFKYPLFEDVFPAHSI